MEKNLYIKKRRYNEQILPDPGPPLYRGSTDYCVLAKWSELASILEIWTFERKWKQWLLTLRRARLIELVFHDVKDLQLHWRTSYRLFNGKIVLDVLPFAYFKFNWIPEVGTIYSSENSRITFSVVYSLFNGGCINFMPKGARF